MSTSTMTASTMTSTLTMTATSSGEGMEVFQPGTAFASQKIRSTREYYTQPTMSRLLTARPPPLFGPPPQAPCGIQSGHEQHAALGAPGVGCYSHRNLDRLVDYGNASPDNQG